MAISAVASLVGRQIREFYDSTTREWGLEAEQTKVLRVGRNGLHFNGSVEQQGFKELFNYGASKGLQMAQMSGAAYAATAALNNTIYLPSGNKMAFFPIVGQTLPPTMAAGGMDIGCDQTDNDGVELLTHAYHASGHPFVIGVSPAFYFKCAFTLGDVSGTDDLQIGFRAINAAVQGAFDNYKDAATLGINTSAATAALKIATIIGDAATVETDTTQTLADATLIEFETRVSSAGVVTYLINGAAPTVTAAYTFTAGLNVVPFGMYLNSSDLLDTFVLSKWEVGLL